MTPILTTWARMALLAVPFADPALIDQAESPDPASDGVCPGTARDTRAAPDLSRLPARTPRA